MTETPLPPEPPSYPGAPGGAAAPTPPPPPPPPPPAPPVSGGYPVSFTFDTPEKIARWRPLLHWLLAIPHFIVLYVLGIVAGILVIIAWFAGVFAGKIPDGLQKPIAMYVRYNTRVSTYMFFLREEYPPFSFDSTFADPGDDARVRLDVVPAVEGRSRLTIFFRYFMIIPHMIVLFVLFLAAYVVLVLGFFAVLILGRWPAGLGAFMIGLIRWSTRVNAYTYLLTDEYPPFRFD